VAREDLAAERREEDDPLDHADEAGREIGALERVAGVLEAAEQERDEDDCERVVAAEGGDDKAVKKKAPAKTAKQPARAKQPASRRKAS